MDINIKKGNLIKTLYSGLPYLNTNSYKPSPTEMQLKENATDETISL